MSRCPRPGGLYDGDDEASRVPGKPTRTHATRSDPGEVAASTASETRRDDLPSNARRRPSHSVHFGAQLRGLRAPCERFAPWVTPGPRITRFRLAADLGRMGLDTHRVSNKVSKITSRHLVPLDRAFPAHALLHESSRARTMLTDRILTCRFMQQRRGGMARRVPAVGVALGWGGSVLPRDPRRGILGGTLGGRCPATAAPRPLAARGESPAAFDRRCIPSACVAPRSNTAAIFPRRALPDERITGLGATLDFHHGLLAAIRCREARASLRGGASHEAEGRRGARGGSAGRVGPPTGWYRQRLLRQILRRRGTCSPA